MPLITKQQAIDNDTFHDAQHRTWRKNGVVKQWVRNPNRFRVPVKYGLFSYDYVTNETTTVHIPTNECPARRRN